MSRANQLEEKLEHNKREYDRKIEGLRDTIEGVMEHLDCGRSQNGYFNMYLREKERSLLFYRALKRKDNTTNHPPPQKLIEVLNERVRDSQQELDNKNTQLKNACEELKFLSKKVEVLETQQSHRKHRKRESEITVEETLKKEKHLELRLKISETEQIAAERQINNLTQENRVLSQGLAEESRAKDKLLEKARVLGKSK